jgi:hypothetical protein
MASSNSCHLLSVVYLALSWWSYQFKSLLQARLLLKDLPMVLLQFPLQFMRLLQLVPPRFIARQPMRQQHHQNKHTPFSNKLLD